jgi:hypothetical protein
MGPRFYPSLLSPEYSKEEVITAPTIREEYKIFRRSLRSSLERRQSVGENDYLLDDEAPKAGA